MLFDVCPDCGGTIDTTIDVCEDHDASDGICEACGGLNRGRFEFECTVCKFSYGTAIWVLMAVHPAVASFLHEHDVDYQTDPWEMIHVGFTGTVELLSRDPIRLGVTFTAGDDELRVTIDDQVRIVDLETSG